MAAGSVSDSCPTRLLVEGRIVSVVCEGCATEVVDPSTREVQREKSRSREVRIAYLPYGATSLKTIEHSSHLRDLASFPFLASHLCNFSLTG